MSFALITGASKGIGKSIANELAKKGYDLLLVARSEDLLKKNAEEFASKYKVKVFYLVTDLSSLETAAKIKSWVISQNFDVTILVNNAGYGMWGKFDSLPAADQNNMMNLNMDSLVNLTYEFLPILKTKKQSYVLNMSSTTAYQAVPAMSVYAASKAFVLAFSRGLSFELRKSNVSVTCVCPGSTDTGFMDRANMNDALKKLADKFNMNPDVVAAIAVKGMFNKKREVIPGFINWISAQATYILPKILIEKIAADIYEKNLPSEK